MSFAIDGELMGGNNTQKENLIGDVVHQLIDKNPAYT